MSRQEWRESFRRDKSRAGRNGHGGKWWPSKDYEAWCWCGRRKKEARCVQKDIEVDRESYEKDKPTRLDTSGIEIIWRRF